MYIRVKGKTNRCQFNQAKIYKVYNIRYQRFHEKCSLSYLCALGIDNIVSIELVFIPETFYMNSAVAKWSFWNNKIAISLEQIQCKRLYTKISVVWYMCYKSLGLNPTHPSSRVNRLNETHPRNWKWSIYPECV